MCWHDAGMMPVPEMRRKRSGPAGVTGGLERGFSEPKRDTEDALP